MSVPRDPYRKDPNAPKDFYPRRVLPIDTFEYCLRTTWWFREMSRRSNGKVFFKNVANSADDICLHIPASYRGGCEKFVQKYGSFLCNQAVNSTDLPVDICSHILEPVLFNTPVPPSWGSGGCWHNSFSTVIYDIFQKDKHRFRKKHTLEELYDETRKMQEKQIDELKYPEDAFSELRKRYNDMKNNLLQQSDNNTPQQEFTPLWKMFGYMFLPHQWLDPPPPPPSEPEVVDVAFDFTFQEFRKRGADAILQDAIQRGKAGKQQFLQEFKEKHVRETYTRDQAKYMYNMLKAIISDRTEKKAVYQQTLFDPQLADKLEEKRQKQITLLKNQIEVLENAILKRERQVRVERGLVPLTPQEVENLKDLVEDIHFETAEADIQRVLQGDYDSNYPLNVNNEAYEDVPPGYKPVNKEYTKRLKNILDAKLETINVLEKQSADYKNKRSPVKPEQQTEWEGYIASKLIWEDLQQNPEEMQSIPPSEMATIQQNLNSLPKSPPPPFLFGIALDNLTKDPKFKSSFPELINVAHFNSNENPPVPLQKKPTK